MESAHAWNGGGCRRGVLTWTAKSPLLPIDIVPTTTETERLEQEAVDCWQQILHGRMDFQHSIPWCWLLLWMAMIRKRESGWRIGVIEFMICSCISKKNRKTRSHLHCDVATASEFAFLSRPWDENLWLPIDKIWRTLEIIHPQSCRVGSKFWNEDGIYMLRSINGLFPLHSY